MANRGTTAKALWRAYLREHIAHTERFNQVYRQRDIKIHLQALAARKSRRFPKPRGRAWQRVWRLCTS